MINIKQVAAILAAITVGLGAFGAHGLRSLVAPNWISIFETGVQYSFYHVLALFAVGILYSHHQNKKLWTAAVLFIAGIVLFSGSLYAMVFATAAHKAFPIWLGPVTPIGGLCFILGWIFVAIGAQNHKK